MKQGVVCLAMVAGALGSSDYEYLRSLGEPEALANAAPAPKPAPPAPTVIVREIVREVRAEPERSRDEAAWSSSNSDVRTRLAARRRHC